MQDGWLAVLPEVQKGPVSMQKVKSSNTLRPDALMLGCLVTVGVLHAVTMIYGAKMTTGFQQFMVMLMNMTAALFLGVVLTRPRSRTPNQTAETLVLLGLGFCLWTAVLQIYDLRYFSLTTPFEPRYGRVVFFCEYLMLLPMAALLDEKGKDRGLQAFFWCFFAAIAVYMMFSILLAVDRVPNAVEPLARWFGTRLGLMWHPNVLSGLMLAGMGVILTLAWYTKRIWLRTVLVLTAGLEYLLMALTNTRTATIMGAFIFAGIVFFHIYRNGSWKRFLVGLLAAAVIIVLLFSMTSMIYSHHLANFPAEGEELEEALRMSGQSSLRQDLVGFTSRDGIWKGAFEAIGDHPQMLIVGSRDIGGAISPYNPFRVAHAHNSWLQTLMGTGIVGFGFILALTWLAVKNILRIWFVKESAMYQKIVGLLATAIMGAQFMEVYIFYTEYPRIGVQAVFMLCVGYLVYWGRILPDRKKKS